MLQEINLSNDRVLCYNRFCGLDASGLSYQDLPQTHWKRNIPGGAIVDTIIHPVTLATELTGRPIDIETNLLSSNGDVGEVLISWQAKKAVCSITI